MALPTRRTVYVRPLLIAEAKCLAASPHAESDGPGLAALYQLSIVAGTFAASNVAAGTTLSIINGVQLTRKRPVRSVGIANLVVGVLNIVQGAAFTALAISDSYPHNLYIAGATINTTLGAAEIVLGAVTLQRSRLMVTPTAMGSDLRSLGAGLALSGRF